MQRLHRIKINLLIDLLDWVMRLNSYKWYKDRLMISIQIQIILNLVTQQYYTLAVEAGNNLYTISKVEGLVTAHFTGNKTSVGMHVL